MPWTAALRESLAGEIVALEGKTLRRSCEQAASQGALPMVSAWAHARRLVFGQRKVDDQSTAIPAIPQLLRMLELEGALVTLDALGCPKEMAPTLTEPGAESVLALKENPPTLPGEGQLWCEAIKADRWAHVTAERQTTLDAEHGRLETRHDWLTADIACLGVQASWAHIASVGLVESHREVGGEVAIEQRLFLTALPGDVVGFAQAVREHWGGEQALQWVLDVSVREDDCRIRQG